MEKKIKELKEELAWKKQQLEELHMVEAQPDWYKIKRFDLELDIANIEDAIDNMIYEKKALKSIERGIVVVVFSLAVLSLILLFICL